MFLVLTLALIAERVQCVTYHNTEAVGSAPSKTQHISAPEVKWFRAWQRLFSTDKTRYAAKCINVEAIVINIKRGLVPLVQCNILTLNCSFMHVLLFINRIGKWLQKTPSLKQKSVWSKKKNPFYQNDVLKRYTIIAFHYKFSLSFVKQSKILKVNLISALLLLQREKPAETQGLPML